MTSRFLLLLALLCTTRAAEPRLLESRKIWDAAPHNAFTDLIRHDDQWLCVFREGRTHVSPDGRIRVLASKDTTNWTSLALIGQPERDLRDPKITLTPSRQLVIYAAAADRPKTPVTHQSVAAFSKNGITWSEPVDIAEKNVWLWRVFNGYGVGYSTNPEKFVRLYRTSNGKNFETIVPTLFDQEHPNESALAFESDGTLLCLLRRDGKPGNGMLGAAKSPYTTWDWKDIGAKIGGPQMIRTTDNRLIAVVRLYDGGARTSVVELNRETGKLSELLKLPSGGDTSYAGMVWHEGKLYISYYSSHEDKTAIYFAKVAL